MIPIKKNMRKRKENKKNRAKQKQKAPPLLGFQNKAQKGNTNFCQDQPNGAVYFFFQYLRTVKFQMINSVVIETS